MHNKIEVKPGSIAAAIDNIKPNSVIGYPRFLSYDHDGDTSSSEFNTYRWAITFSLKVKIFGIKVIYRPAKWPELQSQLPSRTQFRKLSGRRKRLVGKLIERYIMSKGVHHGNSPE